MGPEGGKEREDREKEEGKCEGAELGCRNGELGEQMRQGRAEGGHTRKRREEGGEA